MKMGIQSMNVHTLGRGFSWEHEPPYLTLTCTKRLRPFSSTSVTTADNTVSGSFDLKSFIRPGSGPRKIIGSSSDSTHKKEPVAPVETQPGGTRWNPTQEQIGILEMLYRGGMRTPNAQQIEHITSQLANYGKIEGKNVFYWFQNHKARERQKQKRTSIGLNRSPRTPPSPFSATTDTITTTSLLLSRDDTVRTKGDEVEEVSDGTPYKRKCSNWAFEQFYEETNGHCKENERDGEDRTLKLFPLHPEGRSKLNLV